MNTSIQTTQNTISATGVSGTSYTFTLYPLDTPFKGGAGVYIILKQKTALYVGQTGDFSSRFRDHHKEAAWNRQGADLMAVLSVSTERERLAIEADLIKAYNPTCNG